MTFKILCHEKIASLLAGKVSPDYEIKVFADYDEKEISDSMPNADVLISWLATRKIIESGNALRFIQCWGAGIDEIDVPFAFQRGIRVSNLAGYNSTTVAEYTLCMMQLLNRKLNFPGEKIRQVSRKRLSGVRNQILGNRIIKEESYHYEELVGKVLSIIGYGSIGRQIALRARAFGMKVLAIKRVVSTNFEYNVEFIGTQKDLVKVLHKSDFVSVNLPLTAETKGIFGAKEFEIMKPTAYLVNSSRTGIVDDKSLLSALKKGTIAGAASDVLEKSLEKDFSKLNNVIMTPHISGTSIESTSRGIEVTAENIQRLINGCPLLNPVSPDKIY